jgi:hypothetical protein
LLVRSELNLTLELEHSLELENEVTVVYAFRVPVDESRRAKPSPEGATARGKHPLDREPTGVTTHVRGSLLYSSAQALRAIGRFEEYSGHLSVAAQTAIFSRAASEWHPMAVAEEHYQACEALGLTMMEQIALGHQVSDRVQGTFIALLLRVARNMGVSPWTVIDHVDRIWDRVFRGGGGVRVTRRGPKEANCKLAGLPVIDIPYLRNAFRGAFLAAMERFCERMVVQEVAEGRKAGVVVYRLSWV